MQTVLDSGLRWLRCTEATSSGSETDPQQPWSRFAPATRGAGRNTSQHMGRILEPFIEFMKSKSSTA